MHAEFNNGSAVSRDITRHFSAPLGVRQRLAAHDSSPGGCRMPGLRCRHQTKGLWRLDISPKVPSPASERVAVLGRYALGQPGDCMWPDNRYLASGQRNVKSRQIVQRAKRQSITLTGLGNATILCADAGSGGTPRAIRSNNATAVRHAFRWRCADRGNNCCGAGAICSKAGPTTSRQDA